jgi:hypothetical protein
MTPATFINQTIVAGERGGITTLALNQRLVWLISEAEIMTDMDGVESFLSRYADWLNETAIAFEDIGAVEIASELQAIITSGMMSEAQLNHLNGLINNRFGYNDDTIQQMIAKRLERYRT